MCLDAGHAARQFSFRHSRIQVVCGLAQTGKTWIAWLQMVATCKRVAIYARTSWADIAESVMPLNCKDTYGRYLLEYQVATAVCHCIIFCLKGRPSRQRPLATRC